MVATLIRFMEDADFAVDGCRWEEMRLWYGVSLSTFAE